ncbi:MAG: 30S ribosomal protein S17 [Candidatus Woesearchaeota archaeon]
MDKKVEQPTKECKDNNCPFHGSLRLHGKVMQGTVFKAKMSKTAIVEFTRYKYDPKYERYEKKRTRVKAHNPACINASEGNKVTIIETRPLSKTKNHCIIESK